MGGPELLEGEKLIMELMPHPLAFMRYISICIYYLAVGIGFKYLIEKYLPQLAPRFQGVLTTPGAPIALLVWWALILAVPLIVGIFHITFWPLVCSVLMGVAGTALVLKFNLGPDHLSLLTVASGVLGFFVVEFYRRGHRYYITDQRIIITKKFVSKEERILRYEAITDVVVHKGLMGRIFDFGDVIPITMSGLGLGEDLAGVAVGKEVKKLGVEMAAVGGRTVKVPRARTFMQLFGVPDPERVRNVINKLRAEWSGKPYLVRIAKATEDLLKLVREREGSDTSPLP